MVQTFSSLAVRQVVAGAALAPLLSGCLSVSYVDSSNRRHVVGFVDVVVEQADPGSGKPEPAVVSITTVGVHMYSGGAGGNGSGVVVGYAQETTVVMPNNSCVSLEKPGACAAGSSSETQSGESRP